MSPPGMQSDWKLPFKTWCPKAVSHSCLSWWFSAFWAFSSARGGQFECLPRAAAQKQRLAPRLRAAPLFAFCLLRRGVSGNSRNAPLSIVCFMNFFWIVRFHKSIEEMVCQQHFSPHCVANLSNNGFHKSSRAKRIDCHFVRSCVELVWHRN